MPRRAGLLFGAGLGLFTSAAFGQTALPAALHAGEQRLEDPRIQEPPYDPAAHGGLSYGAWLRATRGTVRRSGGMIIAGVILDSLGASLLVAGTGVYLGGDGCPRNVFGPSGSITVGQCGPRTGHVTGMALMAAGVIGLGLGIPLIVLGAADVPRSEARSTCSHCFTVALGPASAGLRVSF